MNERKYLLAKIPSAKPADIYRLKQCEIDTLRIALNHGASVRRHLHAWQITLPGWNDPTIVASTDGLRMMGKADFKH